MNMLDMLSGEGTYLTSLSTSVLKNAYGEKSEEHTSVYCKRNRV